MLSDDLKIDGTENLWVDTQDLLIGVLYKPPIRSKRKFLDEFEQVLHSIFLSKQKCLIFGDININTLVKRTIAKEYLNLVHSEGFNPFVFEATRITERTISCVDHIHINFVSSSTSGHGSIVVEIDDHFPVFSLSYDPLLSPFPDTIEIRDFKRFDETAFRDELRNEKWKSVCNSSNANESLARFLHTHIMVKPNHIMTKTTPCNGETTSHNGKTTSRNGETTPRNGETTSHNGKTTSHNDESTSHNGETPSYNDETTSSNGETTSQNDETTSHNGETTSCSNE